MLDKETLRSIAAARLEDARLLLAGRQYDGACYLCGYAIELTLKARICDTLGWLGYPESRREWENLSSFKTHDLNVLLHLSGCENRIVQNPAFRLTWSLATSKWGPEMRYLAVGPLSLLEARTMIEATSDLLQIL